MWADCLAPPHRLLQWPLPRGYVLHGESSKRLATPSNTKDKKHLQSTQSAQPTNLTDQAPSTTTRVCNVSSRLTFTVPVLISMSWRGMDVFDAGHREGLRCWNVSLSVFMYVVAWGWGKCTERSRDGCAVPVGAWMYTTVQYCINTTELGMYTCVHACARVCTRGKVPISRWLASCVRFL